MTVENCCGRQLILTADYCHCGIPAEIDHRSGSVRIRQFCFGGTGRAVVSSADSHQYSRAAVFQRKTLFVVEDSSSVTWNRDTEYRPILSTQLPANYVRAYDVETGLLKWEAGGQRGAAPRVNELTGFYFLGAPLVIGERTYVLAESGEGIFLIQIGNPAGDENSPTATNPVILHSQLISIPVFPVQVHRSESMQVLCRRSHRDC